MNERHSVSSSDFCDVNFTVLPIANSSMSNLVYCGTPFSLKYL